MSRPQPKNMDVLQNIEFSVIEVFRADQSLIDADVLEAMNALARHYQAEERGRVPAAVKLSARAQQIFESVQRTCEWRLGRSSVIGETMGPEQGAISLPDLVGCLRKIQKSVPLWSRQGGRKGYLEFVSQYV